MRKDQVALLALTGGVFIFVIKLVAYLVSDSVALLSDALESLVNIAASFMVLVSLRIAERPADEAHKYGHEKAENISSFVEGILILLAAVLIVQASVARLFEPFELQQIDLALIISLTATSLNGLLSFLLFREARRSGSIALEGDARHLFSDVLSSLGVVTGLLIASITGWLIIDPLLALLMAAIIVWMGVGIIRKSSYDLMDRSCPEAERRIKEVLSRTEGFMEYHDLKTRKQGRSVYAELHLCVEGDTTVTEAHRLTERLEKDLEKEIPGIVLNVHVETEDQACESLVGRNHV